MTKLEICERECTNPGQVYLYPEGAFYKAYGVSAWILCEKVYPFKVSVRALKGLDGALLSVGFPISSLEKFASGAEVYDDENANGKVLRFPIGNLTSQLFSNVYLNLFDRYMVSIVGHGRYGR